MQMLRDRYDLVVALVRERGGTPIPYPDSNDPNDVITVIDHMLAPITGHPALTIQSGPPLVVRIKPTLTPVPQTTTVKPTEDA